MSHDLDKILAPFEPTKEEIKQAQEQMRKYSFGEIAMALSMGKGPEFIDRYRAGELTEEEETVIKQRKEAANEVRSGTPAIDG